MPKTRYKMTRRQADFIDRLMVHGCQSRAAREVGCSERNCRTMADKWLTLPKYQHVQVELARRRAARLVANEHEANQVLADLVTVKKRCMQGEEVYDNEGNPTGEWQFDSRGALKAIEIECALLGMLKKDRDPGVFDPTVIILPGANQTVMVTNGAQNGRNLPNAAAPALPDVRFLPHEKAEGRERTVPAVPANDSEGGGRHDD